MGCDSSKARRAFNSPSQKGSALIETTFIFPFLVLLFMGVVDLGRLLNHYMALEQMAGEAARIASKSQVLEAGDEFLDLTGNGLCPDESEPEVGCPFQLRIHTKINDLVSYNEVDFDAVEIRSGYTPLVSGALDEEGSVFVKISADYNGLLPLFKKVPVEVEKRAQYLY